MHGLAEKEPIGFSHFVRWVVAQVTTLTLRHAHANPHPPQKN